MPEVNTRDIVLCDDCSDKSYTPSAKALMAKFGSVIAEREPTGWFLGRMQCQGCGTTEYGQRWRHELKTLSPDEADKMSQPITPEFTEYDKQLAYTAHIDLLTKDQRTQI